jgi:RHS repeat-associated protein
VSAFSKKSKDGYPFGQVLTYRNGSVSDYRYSFQGQEKDDELKGANNSVNFEYRMHDPRIGRFFAIDPLSDKYPYYSPYSFSGNRVLDSREFEGLEPLNAVDAIGNPAYKLKAILSLPDGSQVNIMNAVNGGRFVISRADMQRINSFNGQGYSAQAQTAAPQTTGIATGTTQVQGTVFVDGATQPSQFPNNQFESVNILAPAQTTTFPQLPLQQNLGGQAFQLGGQWASIATPLFNNAAAAGTIMGNQANAAIANLTAGIPPGSAISNVRVMISYNQNMTPNDVAAFQTAARASISAVNPTARVNFTAFDPATDPTMVGIADPNSLVSSPVSSDVQATQTNPPVQTPTLQIVSMP